MTPEQEARANIDRLLEQAGWSVQNADSINLYASSGVAVREFPFEVRPRYCRLPALRQPEGGGRRRGQARRLHPYRRGSPVRESTAQVCPTIFPPTSALSRSCTRAPAGRHNSRIGSTRSREAVGSSRSILPRTLAKWVGVLRNARYCSTHGA